MENGKYDYLAKTAMMVTNAEFVGLMVIGGHKGDGFSVICDNEEKAKLIPTVLREVADKVEALQRAEGTD